MAKRFTDSLKWRKKWFRRLSPTEKCFWLYLIDNCDNAGIWDTDFDDAAYNIGSEINEQEIRIKFAKQFIEFEYNGAKKWWLIDYIEFQYSCTLKELFEKQRPSNLHLTAIKSIKKHGLLELDEPLSEPSANPEVTFEEPSANLQGTFEEPSANLQGTFEEPSANLQGTFEEPSANLQGTFEEPSANLRRTLNEKKLKGNININSKGNIKINSNINGNINKPEKIQQEPDADLFEQLKVILKKPNLVFTRDTALKLREIRTTVGIGVAGCLRAAENYMADESDLAPRKQSYGGFSWLFKSPEHVSEWMNKTPEQLFGTKHGNIQSVHKKIQSRVEQYLDNLKKVDV